MKSFIQYNEHNVQTLDPAEDDNKGLFNVQDPNHYNNLMVMLDPLLIKNTYNLKQQ